MIKNKLLITVIIFVGLIPSACCNKQTNSDKKTNNTEIKKNVIVMDSMIRLDTMGYPIISKEFETFDFETYEERPPENPELGGYRESHYTKRLSNGIVTQMDVAGEGMGGGFYHHIYYPNSYFRVFRHYYPNGNIKEKGLTYVQGFDKGVWYKFDETGKLIKETDYDKPFEFTFEDILKFCEKHNIYVEKGYESSDPTRDVQGMERYMITYIYRNCFEEACQWEIEYIEKVPKTEFDYIQVNIILDGKTGKIISKEQKPYLIEI